MRREHRSSINLTVTGVLFFGLVLGAAVAPSASAAQSPCQAADKLRATGLLSEADAQYRKILTVGGVECAAPGVRAIVAERARRARVFAAELQQTTFDNRVRGRLTDAIREGRETRIPGDFKAVVKGGDGIAIARAARLSGYPQVAADVLAAAVTAKPDLTIPADLRGLSDGGLRMSAARALARAGLQDAAREQLKLALQADPTLTAPSELKSPDRRSQWWRDLLGDLGPWLRTAAEVGILLLAIPVALLLLWRLGRRLFVRRIVVEPFAGTDDKVAAATTAAVHANYGTFQKQTGERRLGLVTSSGEPFPDLPTEVFQAYPQTKLLAALIGFLERVMPSRSRLVSGFVRPRDPQRGAGVNVTFGRRHGKVLDREIVWESDYGGLAASGEPQLHYDAVAVPVAVWMMFRAGRRSFWHLRHRDFKALGTESWRSYALFAKGGVVQGRSQERARRLYLDALNCDGRNQGAQLNLSAIEMGLEAKETDKDARDQLWTQAKERVSDLEASLGGRHHATNPMWYRARYLQTLALLHPDHLHPLEARRAAVGLCSTIIRRLDRLEHWWCVREKSRALRDLLRDSQPYTLMTLASALCKDGRPAARIGPVDRTVALASEPETLRRGTLKRCLREFAKHPEDVAEFDGAVHHDDIAIYVQRQFAPLNGNARFNLACYHARRHHWGAAEEELRGAIELLGETGRWALRDQALREYREQDGHLKTLQRWVDRRTRRVADA